MEAASLPYCLISIYCNATSCVLLASIFCELFIFSEAAAVLRRVSRKKCGVST